MCPDPMGLRPQHCILYQRALCLHIYTTRSVGGWSCVYTLLYTYLQNYMSEDMPICVWAHMFHICLHMCALFWVCIGLQAQLCEFMHLEYAGVCICCAHSHHSEPMDICAHAYWSFLITSVLSTDSCFNNIYSWASTLTAVAPSCYQDCFSPFRITSAQCSLNISLLLIPKQRCNDFY